jgi:predicted RNA binding protein YcfA (HicA-like mRNA interferase family)
MHWRGWLKSFGYEIVRQSGSHMRLTTAEYGEHHITIPRHDALRIGTLAGILADVAEHAGVSRDDVAIQLFG